jgi:hypothetical protein
MIILKLVVEGIGWVGVGWISKVQSIDQLWVLVNMVVNIQIS